jgi:thiamine monophosphate synthase
MSCYNYPELLDNRASKSIAYASFGAFNFSQTKPNAKILSQEDINNIKKIRNIKKCIIGGINKINIKNLYRLKFDMIAISSALFLCKNTQESANFFVRNFQKLS